MTTRLTISNEPDSSSAHELIISATNSDGGAPLQSLKPGRSATYSIHTASSLTIEERDATPEVQAEPAPAPVAVEVAPKPAAKPVVPLKPVVKAVKRHKAKAAIKPKGKKPAKKK